MYINNDRDENVLKKWRRDRRSFCISMEKAMKRSEGILTKFQVEKFN